VGAERRHSQVWGLICEPRAVWARGKRLMPRPLFWVLRLPIAYITRMSPEERDPDEGMGWLVVVVGMGILAAVIFIHGNADAGAGKFYLAGIGLMCIGWGSQMINRARRRKKMRRLSALSGRVRSKKGQED